ncbi:MAG: carotenoid oxygenase family protein, partial [Pseudomonadota bacterium]
LPGGSPAAGWLHGLGPFETVARATRFGVAPRPGRGRDDAPVRWFEFPGCYVYHVINAWEEGDEVVMAACRMVPNGLTPDVEAYGAYAAMVDVLALRAQPFIWRMNMRTGEGRAVQLDDRLSEFPVVDGAHVGRKARFAYHVVMDDCAEQRFCALLKYDLETGGCERHDFGPGRYGSEPAFAARPDPCAEDDGYVVTFVTPAGGEASEIVVIDAQNFSGAPVARIAAPQRIPAGFHGVWAPGVV